MHNHPKKTHRGLYASMMALVSILGGFDLWLIHSLLEGTASSVRVAFWILGGGFILCCLGLIHYFHRRHRHLVEKHQVLTSEKESLEVLNRAKSEFLSLMSHEFRTPLNAIIGFAEALDSQTQGGLNPKQLRYVENIRKGGEYLLALINNVLDLSRLELGKLTLRWAPIDLGEVLHEITLMLDEQARHKQITLRCSIQEDLPPLHADPTRLRQILYNLVHNAVKFTPELGCVDVNAYATDHQVIIRVKDTGIGIAPEEQERIFEMFQQVDSSRTRNQQGTGLGLALCKQLVELHGGRIDLQSKPGEGSTFTVHLLRYAKQEDLVEGQGISALEAVS